MTGGNGSIAPIRFLKKRPFDQRFVRLGSPNFERLLCRVFHCGCDDEQRLLCFETGHSRREFFEASMAEGGRKRQLTDVGSMTAIAAKRTTSAVRRTTERRPFSV